VFVAALSVLGGIAGAAGPLRDDLATDGTDGDARAAVRLVAADAPATVPAPPVRPPTVPVRANRTALEPAISAWDGVASWYGEGFAGERTASGERFDPAGFTAAHRTLAFGTRLRVTHLRTGRSVEVVVTDRGPYVRGRDLDLSRAAAETIGLVGRGHADVRIEVLA
jgi:rare lipoprotein A